ncbi:MAG: cbb3-type cytochrome c oxidase N-terminal domain-containing protein [bacterium]
MNDKHDKLLDHDYDGIRELDNDLPRWWLWMFYVSIVFAFLYMTYYHVLDVGYSSSDAYASEIDPNFVRPQDLSATYFGLLPQYRSPLAATYDDMQSASSVGAPKRFGPVSRQSDTTTYVALTQADAVAAGKEVFIRNCASCHGFAGEGGVGPNLTDDYWLHGGDFSSIVKTVRYGFPTKGMISWLGTLPPEQILQAASYVTTLHGTNPPNAKAAEGELYTP